MPVIDIYNLPGTYPKSGDIFDGGFGSTTTHYIRAVEDWTINSHTINHLNAGFTKRYRIEEAPNSGGQWNSQTGFTGEYEDLMFPNFGIQHGPGTPNSIMLPGGNIGFFTDGSYEFDDNVTWTKGNHTVNFGIGHRRQGFSSVYDSNAAADFSFNDVLTNAGEVGTAPVNSNSGDGLASFFLGAASGGTIGGPSVASMRARYWDFYGQDDWKISPKMTANVGLRYEIPDPVEEHKCWSSQVNFGKVNTGADGLRGAMDFQGRGPGLTGQCSPMTHDWKAWGPRVGGVYQIDDKTVVRAAYGVYYTPLKISNFANTDSGGFSLPGYKWPTQGNLQQPAVFPSQVKSYPGNTTLPDVDPTEFNGLVGGGGAATGGAIMLPSRLAKPGLVQNWTFDIQRQLPGGWLFDAAYVGNHGQDLQALEKDPNVLHDYYLGYGDCLGVEVGNAATDAACQAAAAKGFQIPSATGPYQKFVHDFGSAGNHEDTVAQALRPFPMYQTEDLDTSFSPNPWGNYTYEALQVKMTKRYGSGLTVMANYTWSKNLTNADSDYAPQSAWNGGSSAGLLDPDNPQQQKSISEFDQPQNVKVAYTYELPWGSKRPYMNHVNPVIDLVAGNWTVGGIDSYGTGYPIAITEPGVTVGTFAGAATGPSLRPNVVPGQPFKSYSGSVKGYTVNTTKLINPAAFVNTGNYAFGNAPRELSNVRNFFHKDEDLQVGKPFPLIGERLILNFRFDAFNIFNRHSFGCMDGSVGDTNFGAFTCGAGPNSEVNNNITSSVPPSRTMQGNVRITF
jgi:hypothetical protein